MSCISSPRVKESIRSAPCRTSQKWYHSETIPSRITLPLDTIARRCSTPNTEIKSKYCAAELNKSESGRRSRINVSAKMHESTVNPPVEELRQKDLHFVRKMLAMNKKQEMMLNKRLAKLMEEDVNNSEGRENYKSISGNPSDSSTKAGEKEENCVKEFVGPKIENNILPSNFSDSSSNQRLVEEKTTEEITPNTKIMNSTSKVIPTKRLQYDINGRRIYQYSDIERDSIDDESDVQVCGQDNQKIIKKGPICSKNTFTMTSLTRSKKPATKNKKIRKEDGNSPSCGNSVNKLQFELRPKEAGCQGDGKDVQNVVVHCSTVFSHSTNLKKHRKVWDYESIHSLKSEKNLDKNKNMSFDQKCLKNAERNRNERSRSNKECCTQTHLKRTPVIK